MYERRRREVAGAPPAEVSASEVKNGWHEYLDRVSRAREEIVITRYGRPVARLTPMPAGEDGTEIFGFLRGSVQVRGDLTAPSGEAWDADA